MGRNRRLKKAKRSSQEETFDPQVTEENHAVWDLPLQPLFEQPPPLLQPPPPPLPIAPWEAYSKGIGSKVLKSLGYTEGQGLGKKSTRDHRYYQGEGKEII